MKQPQQRDGQGKGALKDFAVGALLDAIPGAGTAKGIFDLVRSTYKMPDEKKTNTALDFLNVDDEVSAIVDDTIENAFLKVLGQELEGESDERRLEDLDVTTLLQKYIAREFEKRLFLATENKMKITKEYLRDLINEEVKTQQDVEKEKLDSGLFLKIS